MARFTKIRYKNILSTGNVWQEYDFTTVNLLLVIGKNGAGKTTVIDALFFALYGEAYRDIVKKKIINSVNKKECVVELWFTVGKTEYFIRRGIKPDIFEFYVDGVLAPKDAKSKDYQLTVDKAVRIDKKSLSGQVVLASRSYTPFMRLSAPDSRTVIQDVLDIQVFTEMSKINKARLDAIKEEIATVDAEKKEYKYKIDIERSKLTISQKNTEESIDRYERSNAVLEGQIEHLRSDVTQLTEECFFFDDREKELKSKSYEVWETNAKVGEIRKSYTTIKNSKTWYETANDCPTCKQHINAVFKAEMINDLSSQLDTIAEEGKTLKQQNEELTKQIEAESALLSELRVKNNKITVKRGEIASKLDEIKRNKREIENLRSIVDSEGADQDVILLFQKKYNLAVAQYTMLSEEQDRLRVAAQLLKDDGMKTSVINRYLPTINATINKYIRELGFNAIFNMTDTFKETITDQYGEEFSYHSFSEGEKMRFDLAIMFTWRDIAKSRNTTDTNLLIMDEVLDASLDAEGAQEFMRVISKIVKDTNTIIISHQSENIIDKFDKVIEFKKVKKFSQMKVIK